MEFLQFVEESSQCKGRSDLIELFDKALSKFGFEKFNYGLAKNGDIQKNVNFIALGKNYPLDWVKYYFDKKYQFDDPRLSYALKHTGPFTWHSLSNKPAISKKAKLILNVAEDAGLKSGISIAIHGPQNNIFVFNFASQMHDRKLNENQTAELYAIANQFHHIYLGLGEKIEFDPQHILLSQRQIEVLTWISLGKSTSIISDIMSISESTVDDHLRHIFRKLDCNCRIVAVVKASKLGLLNI